MNRSPEGKTSGEREARGNTEKQKQQRPINKDERLGQGRGSMTSKEEG